MASILTHHHLDFWNGSRKRTQMFFAGRPSVDDIVAAIHAVLDQNRVVVAECGSDATYLIEGEFSGANYALGVTSGAIRTFYPLWN